MKKVTVHLTLKNVTVNMLRAQCSGNAVLVCDFVLPASTAATPAAWHGMAWPGMARGGTGRDGMAWHGHGMARHGMVIAWQGEAWHGMA